MSKYMGIIKKKVNVFVLGFTIGEKRDACIEAEIFSPVCRLLETLRGNYLDLH